MIRRAALVVGAVVFIGCSTDAAPRSNQSSSSAPTTTTTTAPTTTTTVPLSPAGSPQEAATTFVNAWRNADRDAALTIALPTAVDAVFAAGEPGSPQNRGCNHPPADTPVLCVYKTAVGELQVRAQPRPDGWIVDQAIVSAA
ncbi:MAG: hypothetical protein QOI95_2265 [Acidimicrobiaceae bacterium]|jgi:hypothetical protein